jgi:hypothetical protein
MAAAATFHCTASNGSNSTLFKQLVAWQLEDQAASLMLLGGAAATGAAAVPFAAVCSYRRWSQLQEPLTSQDAAGTHGTSHI